MFPLSSERCGGLVFKGNLARLVQFSKLDQSESPISMAKRLTELYQPGDKVEILMGDYGWMAGVVMQHAQPAVWVQTQDGRFWFVTNRRRIRKQYDET